MTKDISPKLQAHLDSGATTLCRCWKLQRKDGTVFGFCDHDGDIEFDGLRFEAASGMNAAALQSTAGLGADNSEAIGALNSNRIKDIDIDAGVYDDAEIWHWLVNWRDVEQRVLLFRGKMGELRRGAHSFEAELRGLSDDLNKTTGRAYLRQCSANLGDTRCGVRLGSGFVAEVAVVRSDDRRVLYFNGLGEFAAQWFKGGEAIWLDGENRGQRFSVRDDRQEGAARVIALGNATRRPVAVGDRVKLVVGCDKKVETCRARFNNIANYQGFPFIPGEDWLVRYPTRSGLHDGKKQPN